jgi:transcription antitermination protein NusB
MSARSKARKRALDVVFEADAKGVPVLAVLGEHQRRRVAEGDTELNPYSIELVEGVAAHIADIDQLISTHSTGWSLERMPTVDRAILRIAVFEMVYDNSVPDAVVVSQAVELAKELSTDDSGSFVHGLLGAISRKQDSPIG